MKVALLIGFLRGTTRLPWSILYAIGTIMGLVAWHLARKRRLVALTNLRACFPGSTDAQVRRMAKDNFRNTGIGILESTMAYFGTKKKIVFRCDVHGLEHIEMARATGRGVLLLSGHATCIELVLRAVNEHLSPPAWQLVRRNNNPTLESAIETGRIASSERTIEKKNLRAVLKALKQGRALFYGPDQNFTYHHVFAPFFGIPAASVTATADLCSRANAIIVPVWGYRDTHGRYQITVEAPWQEYPAGDPIEDAGTVNRWLESRIREHPEQYLWTHRRFRTRPEGEGAFYPDEALRKKHQEQV